MLAKYKGFAALYFLVHLSQMKTLSLFIYNLLHLLSAWTTEHKLISLCLPTQTLDVILLQQKWLTCILWLSPRTICTILSFIKCDLVILVEWAWHDIRWPHLNNTNRPIQPSRPKWFNVKYKNTFVIHL